MLDADKDEHGLRVFSQDYCLELFPDRWRKSSKVISLLWDRMAVGFEKALADFYSNNYFTAKFLGEHNYNASLFPFVQEGRNLALPIACSYDADEAAPFKFVVDASREVKLLRQSAVLELFKTTCERLGTPWGAVAGTITPFLTDFYADRFLMIAADAYNGTMFHEAFEDQSSVDLRIRLNASKGASS